METTSDNEGKIAMVVSVSEERIGVVIGTRRSVEKKIERLLGVKIKVRPGREEILIVAPRDNIENALKAKMVVEAIAHGFSPQDALILAEKSDYTLEVINIEEYAKSGRDLSRIRARLIGKGGKIKSKIEDELGVKIAISGKKVAIIGKYWDVLAAKEAVVAICRGSKHGRVLKKVEEYRMARAFREIVE